MPRPCEKLHPLSPATCRLCLLASTDPRYQRLWGEPGGEELPLPPSFVACEYLGRRVHPPTAPDNVREWHVCEHPQQPLGPSVCPCRGCGPACKGYTAEAESDESPPPRPFQGPVARHLAYHLYPLRGGAWTWNVMELRRRIGLFNGHRVVAVALDQNTDDMATVRRAFAGDVHEFVEVANDADLREVATFVPLWERIALLGPNDVTFFAHAKGMTRSMAPGQPVRLWAEMLYETCLDYWPLAERLLQRHALAGSMKKIGQAFAGSKSRWHYSGTFFWARNSQVFKRNWREIDREWWGTEAWAGAQFPINEGGVLFHEGSVSSLDLYKAEYLRDTVLPELESWRKKNSRQRRGP